jgi:hypothetical protein
MATFPDSSGFEAGLFPLTQLDKRIQASRRAGTCVIGLLEQKANQLVFSKKQSS